jgi:hypothetical protein
MLGTAINHALIALEQANPSLRGILVRANSANHLEASSGATICGV